jgi:hypothetical protein
MSATNDETRCDFTIPTRGGIVSNLSSRISRTNKMCPCLLFHDLTSGTASGQKTFVARPSSCYSSHSQSRQDNRRGSGRRISCNDVHSHALLQRVNAGCSLAKLLVKRSYRYRFILFATATGFYRRDSSRNASGPLQRVRFRRCVVLITSKYGPKDSHNPRHLRRQIEALLQSAQITKTRILQF